MAVARRAGRRRGAIGGTPVELLDFVSTGGAYSIDKARRVLGYQPEDSCVEAWAGLYEWWLARPRTVQLICGAASLLLGLGLIYVIL